MKIESRAFHPRPRSFPEIDAQVRLVGRRIQAESGVPVDPENRFVHLGDGQDVRRDQFQADAQGLDKCLGRLHDIGLKIAPVVLEPNLIIVIGELFKKPDRFFRKSLKTFFFGHDGLL